MKIGAVGFYNLNRKQNINNKAEDVQNRQFCTQTSPFNAGLNSDKISFTGVPSAGKVFKKCSFPLKNIQNVPCPCCGRIMITPKDFETKLTEKILSSTSRQAINALEEFESSMHPVEKACFQQLKTFSKMAPQKSLSEILQIVRPEYIKKLNVTQFKILDQLDGLGKNLPYKSSIALAEITSSARQSLKGELDAPVFKRKPLIKQIAGLTPEIRDRAVANKLYAIVNTLPSAGSDLNSFMVKYSTRSSREIGQMLVYPSLASKEHIRPKNPIEKGMPKGNNFIDNYLSECIKCNGEKKRMSLVKFLKTHPEMPKNTKNYLGVIIRLINRGDLTGYEFYPLDVSETLYTESRGRINLRAWVESKLKIDYSKYESKFDVDLKPLEEKFNKKKPIG